MSVLAPQPNEPTGGLGDQDGACVRAEDAVRGFVLAFRTQTRGAQVLIEFEQWQDRRDVFEHCVGCPFDTVDTLRQV